MQEIPRYSGCFVCGDQNPSGLKAKFFFDGERAVCTVTADRLFEGYKNILHGGIISTLLDEVMIKAILARDLCAVTAEMSVRFRKPVAVGQSLTFTGWITKERGRIIQTEGRFVD
jgi:uncharacterized protein (TIGR00369 family)